MLEKKALLGVAKDDQGLVLVDKETKKGVRIPEEGIMQLTLVVWELCDKLECVDIVAKLIGDAPATAEQKGMLNTFVEQSLAFFQKMGWAVTKGPAATGKKEAPAKKEAQAKKKPAVSAKKK